MKKILMILVLVVGLLTLSGCFEKPTDTKLLEKAINGIGTIYSLETESDTLEGNESIYGQGSAVMIVDEGPMTIEAILVEEGAIVLISIETKKQLLSDNVTITDIEISYGSIKRDLYVEVNYWDVDNEYKSDLTIEEWAIYISKLKVSDILNILLKENLIQK
jgi:hypothetical protein